MDISFLEVGSVSEDWEQDFDIELTEEDLKAAEEIAQKMKITDKDYNTITGVSYSIPPA